jgi:hypothetical protein
VPGADRRGSQWAPLCPNSHTATRRGSVRLFSNRRSSPFRPTSIIGLETVIGWEAKIERSVISLQRSECREAKGKLTMRSLLILVAIFFSATAFAQSAPPKVGNKTLVQVKPKEPMGCKLVGTVRGTKLWAGDCVGSELRGSTTTTETQVLPQQATGAITPNQKE